MARIPKYRRHSTRDFAFVEVGGERKRLPGRYNSEESRIAYSNILRQLAESEAKAIVVPGALTVVGLVARFLDYAQAYYGPKEYNQLRYAGAHVQNTSGDSLADDFGPASLVAARDSMIRAGWSRPYINHQIQRVRFMFRWGAAQELVKPDVPLGLGAVLPLRKGRTVARETDPIKPVPFADVDRTIPFLGPVVADMVRLQMLTGMRSDSICALRPCDIAQAGEVWVCRPKHKMEYRGTVLEVFLGPKAQAILKPYLERDPQAYCFSPRESEAKRFEAIRKRKKKATPRRGLRDRYDSVAYWHAIQHGLRKAKKANVEIPSWHPHQIRHAVSTLIRARYGIEAAKAFLGHGDVETALIYAEKDTEAAKRIAHEMG